jgi:hypothetical protein
MGVLNLIGSDGNATMPTGYAASINTWSASFSRVTSVVTGFGDAGHRRVASTVLDITGSAAGVPTYVTASSSSLGIGDTSTGADSQSITLHWDDGSGVECKVQFSCVFNSVSFSSTNDGDATVTFNFEAGGSTTAPVFTWEEI